MQQGPHKYHQPQHYTTSNIQAPTTPKISEARTFINTKHHTNMTRMKRRVELLEQIVSIYTGQRLKQIALHFQRSQHGLHQVYFTTTYHSTFTPRFPQDSSKFISARLTTSCEPCKFSIEDPSPGCLSVETKLRSSLMAALTAYNSIF
eukprot:c48544_g1_i1 orf=3-443(-)